MMFIHVFLDLTLKFLHLEIFKSSQKLCLLLVVVLIQIFGVYLRLSESVSVIVYFSDHVGDRSHRDCGL